MLNHFKGQTAPAMGQRLPNAKMSITESMLQMLTNEHLAEQRKLRKTTGSTTSKKATEPASSPAPGGFIRTVRSAKQGKSQEWQLSTENVERAKSSPITPHDRPEVQSSKAPNICEVPVGDAVPEVDGKTFLGAASPVHDIKGDDVVVPSRGKYFKKAWEGSKGPDDPAVDPAVIATGAVPDEGVGPSVVLRASSSGNNINVSCTFDKNLLNSEKAVALKFNTDKTKDADEIIEEIDEAIKEITVPKNKSTIAKKSTGRPSTKTATTQSKSGNDTTERVKQKSAQKREREILKVDEGSQTFLAELNKDNLDCFSAEKRYGATKQRKIIEAWVEDVNEHIEAGTLALTGENVLSEADKSRVQSVAGPIRKAQPTNEMRSSKQPVTWQLKTKNLTLPERPSTSEQSKTVENINITPQSLGINNFNIDGLWSRLRDMASTPFRGLYNNKFEDLPPPSVPIKAKPKRVSVGKVRQQYMIDHDPSMKRGRHGEKKIPPLHESHQPNYTSSSSSGRQPRKSAKASIYVSENLSYNSCATRNKSKFFTFYGLSI